MRAPPAGRWAAVQRAARRLRTEAVVSLVLVAVTAVPFMLLVGWMVGERWGLRSMAPLVILTAALSMVGGIIFMLARRWLKPLTEESVAAAAERGRGLPDGSLRGVMELEIGRAHV